VPTNLTEQYKNQCSEVTFADILWSKKKKELLDSTTAAHFTPQTKQVGMQ